ncbi:D-alanyl-D-alanine carboxypeptidase [Streptomyces sp. NPDC059255]|uniref:D-alanyl-D-alanine carboxypeptidase family protein n=1 Tax=Streptomyces sp. NPDC059255 TaxID=3346793 RepID=UPI0036CDF126
MTLKGAGSPSWARPESESERAEKAGDASAGSPAPDGKKDGEEPGKAPEVGAQEPEKPRAAKDSEEPKESKESPESKDSDDSDDSKAAAKASRSGGGDDRPAPASGSGYEPGAKAEPESGGKSGAGSGSEPGAKSESGSGSEPQSKSESGSGSEPQSKSESGSGTKAGSKSGAGSGSEPGSKSEPGAGSKPGPKPGSESKRGSDPESKSKPVSDPESKSGSKTEPGAKSGAGPVDQATAVFKTLPKPTTDQPTTALKLPKSADVAEAPAERTSTFVPLRRDDRPAPAASPAAPAASKPAQAPAPAPSPAPSGFPEAERTRQQPLPPMPPLDLLAELTNKPAPPETPVRTMVRRVKIWTPLVLLAVVVFAVVQAVRPLPAPELMLSADSEYSFDGDKPTLPWPDHGQGAMSVAGLGAVDSFGEQKPVPIASVTKSMTAYIIMRDHPMKVGQDGAMIPVDALAEKEGGYDESGNESTLNTIKEGDKLSQKDALSALMIPSANNVARLLARWDAGSQDAFVKKMNDAAEELGMKDTKYTDPSGLDATTVSTASDQVKLGLELVKMQALMVITQLPQWTDPSGKTWPNWNTLVPYNGAIGIKTGTTTKAGGNLLFAATKDVEGTKKQYVVGAILGQRGPSIIDAVNAASKKVLIDTRELLVSQTVVKKGQTVGYVDDGLGGQTPVVATKDLTAAGWPSLKISLGVTDGGKAVPQTAAAGTVVGQLTVGSGPGQVTAPVALQEDLVEPGFGAKLTRVG